MLYAPGSQVGPHQSLPLTDKASLIKLFEGHYQTNRHLWQAVMTLGDEQFSQTPGNDYPSIQTQIIRMVANENLWVNYLWHGEVEFLHESQFPTRACIRAEWDALEEEITDFIGEIDSAELERRVTPPFLDSGASLTVGEILLQIISDAVECRAQLRLHLYRLGISSLPENQRLL